MKRLTLLAGFAALLVLNRVLMHVWGSELSL